MIKVELLDVTRSSNEELYSILNKYCKGYVNKSKGFCTLLIPDHGGYKLVPEDDGTITMYDLDSDSGNVSMIHKSLDDVKKFISKFSTVK